MAKTLLDLLDGLAPAFQKAFLQAIADRKSDVQIAALTDAIRRADTAAVARILALGPEYFMPLDTMMREAQLAGGGFTLEAFTRKAKRAGVDAVARFNGRNLRAETLLRNQSSKLITRISDGTRDVVRDLLRDGMQAGRGPRSVALDLVGRFDKAAGRRIGGVIGLTPGDVETAHRALGELTLRRDVVDSEVLKMLRRPKWQRATTGEVQAEAKKRAMAKYLGRKLRNKTYDRAVMRAIRAGKPVPADIARKIVSRYQDKLLFKRGETIARTELLQSLHAAQDEAFQQLFDDGKLKPDQVTSTWDSAEDSATRDAHRDADGQVRNEAGFFTIGGYQMKYPGDSSQGAGPELIVNCRCVVHKSVDFIAGLKPGD